MRIEDYIDFRIKSCKQALQDPECYASMRVGAKLEVFQELQAAINAGVIKIITPTQGEGGEG